MIEHPMLALAGAALLLTACSSRPRQFAPVLAAAPADAARYDVDHETCRALVAKGQRSGFGPQLASGGVGVASAAGVGAATMSGAGATMAGTVGAASAAAVMMPVVGIAAAWGLAKRSKAKKEREIKQATALCLSEKGYQVDAWRVARKGGKRAASVPTQR